MVVYSWRRQRALPPNTALLFLDDSYVWGISQAVFSHFAGRCRFFIFFGQGWVSGVGEEKGSRG